MSKKAPTPARKDARVESAERLLTGPRLLAGAGAGQTCRVPGLTSLLGAYPYPGAVQAWVEAEGLWIEPPYHALHLRPNAGLIDLDRVRTLLLKLRAEGHRLPFKAESLPELSHV